MIETEKFVIEALKLGIKDIEALRTLKSRFAAELKRPLFSNIELLDAYRDLIKKGELTIDNDFWKLLRRRGVRSKSGIVSITILTKKYACPGACIYCPGEPEMPKSYLSNEPAVMRAILSDFDSYKQTINRLISLERSGHLTDKVEVIVSGGTFSFYPKPYQKRFALGMYNALNYPHKKERSLIKAQTINEKAKHRCIGLSFETRPDYIDEKEIVRLRKLGATKIELGVQSLNDHVLELNKRGHFSAETINATRLLKDAGFKINYHMMPNLYGSNFDNDLNDFKKLFEDPDFKPDWLKIYPCMVVPWSKLEGMFKSGLYKPYSDEELKKLLIQIKMLVPEYVRIARLYRDIPSQTILGGSKLSNIRQIIGAEMDKRNLKCRCIRCREIQNEKVAFSDLKLNTLEYEASEGKEFFITFDEVKKDKLCSLLRLRFTSYSLKNTPHFIKELDGASIIREVHTYGEQLKIGNKGDNDSQHIGLGRRMINHAEELSRKAGYSKIAVISGIGVREYYRKIGYNLEGTYMVKSLI